VSAAVLVSLVAFDARAAAPAGLVPVPAVYGVHKTSNVPVVMRDGVTLRVDVYRPADLRTGEPAPGPFPVLLAQTPYGKSDGSQGGHSAYLVERGYIQVVADVRGKGYSEGVWDFNGPAETADGAELVWWSSRLPGSTGEVGLYGASYLGIIQFHVAAEVGPNSPLKAIAPMISSVDLYRDQVFYGGMPNESFGALIGGLTASDSLGDPVTEGVSDGDPGEIASVIAQHSGAPGEATLSNQLEFHNGGNRAYDSEFWRSRAAANKLERIVANDIPALMIGGWFDLFLRGTPLGYTGLQNAAAGRSVHAPMDPKRKPDRRYQLIVGPHYHATTTLDYDRILLEWYDTWLKGRRTAFSSGATMRLFEFGADRWIEGASWPLPGTETESWYLTSGPSDSGSAALNDGVLQPTPPTTSDGADTVVWTPEGSPCQRQTEMQSAGLATAVSGAAGLPTDGRPCFDDERTLGAGPSALTYTTAPFEADRTLAGPITASIAVASTTRDAYLVASIQDVAPDGTATPLTAGALLARFRANDETRSWRGTGGRMLRPYHPFTPESVEFLTPGEPTRVDIEVFPTFARVPKGHHLRLTLTTNDTPHVQPAAYQVPDLVGGVYTVQRNTAAASFVNFPFVDPTSAGQPCGPICATTAAG
jgi:putative CocE/NonD family hydrolase